MTGFIRKNFLFLLGVLFVLVFFHKVFIYGLFPIPTDNIVALYHPYRDFYSQDYPRGIPFQNIQVADPVRQQYLWRELVISQMKGRELPLWNPYNFSGYPLLANFQSAAFYPLNITMFVLPFEYAWTLLIISQPLLSFIFMFLYLRNLKISSAGSFIGSVAFAFSGFFVSWLEWGNIASTGLWLPIILLSIDKIFQKITNTWSFIFLFSLVAAFFAGHLQTFFYLFLVSFAYIILRWFSSKRRFKTLLIFTIYYLLLTVLTAVQWFPTLQLVQLSGRSIDQVSSTIEGWFIPWQNLVQFIAPDFFGNPATLNYWGIWNYGEFIGYVGLLPLILALLAVFFIRDRIVLFYSLVLVLGIIFSYPSVVSSIPFRLDIPFISTSQPTRLLYVIDFSLVVLAAFGFDYYVKNKNKILVPLSAIGVIVLTLWSYVLWNGFFPEYIKTSAENLAVSYSNLRLPTIIFAAIFLLFIFDLILLKKLKGKKYSKIVVGILILIFLFDIFRFADKYTVFSKKEYLYPDTKSLEYLGSQEGEFRVMEADGRILPPNFSIYYGIYSIDGYDPLYLLRYGELAAAIGRNEPNINPPFGFNRIITPQNYLHELSSLLNVKYVLSIDDISSGRFDKEFEEGSTKIYRNNTTLPRAYFVEETIYAEDKHDSIEKLFEYKDRLRFVAILEGEESKSISNNWTMGSAEIDSYSPNKVVVKVENTESGFLVLTDSFYPTWRVSIDGVKGEIVRTNYNFRGVVVPAGSKEVIFTNHLF